MYVCMYVCMYACMQSFLIVFDLPMGALGGSTFSLSPRYKWRKQDGKSSKEKNRRYGDEERLDSAFSIRQSRLGLGPSVWPNFDGTENSQNFQIFRKNDNLQRLTKSFETNFSKISVPFDYVPGFPEISVQWIAPLILHESETRPLSLPRPPYKILQQLCVSCWYRRLCRRTKKSTRR